MDDNPVLEKVREFSRKIKPFDHLYSDYHLSVSVVRTCAILLLQAYYINESDQTAGAAEHLFRYLCKNHPETEPIIREFLEFLNQPEN